MTARCTAAVSCRRRRRWAALAAVAAVAFAVPACAPHPQQAATRPPRGLAASEGPSATRRPVAPQAAAATAPQAKPATPVRAPASPAAPAGRRPALPSAKAGGGAASAGSLGGCPDLPADSVWHADVSRLPVDSHSSAYVAGIGAGSPVKADFGSGSWDGGPIGIPITYVPAGSARAAMSFDYAEDSDPGPYPIPANALVEGGANATGDRHVLVVEEGTCRLYETWDSHPQPDGSWHAGSGATFDLRSNVLRPAGWTSADAAGLPVAPGLVRYEDVAAGRLHHAIRVTVPRSQNRYVWPARHAASASSDPSLPPMGLRLRLKAGVDIASLPPQARIIAQAMKTYGVIVADNGSAWYMSGTPDARWDNDALRALAGLHGSDFEAVDTSALQVSATSGAAR